MKEIELKTLNNAIRLLNAIKCSYAIIDTDGNKHGTLEIAEKKTERRYPHGSITKHVKEYIKHLSPGEFLEIPVGSFDFETIQSVACSLFHKYWGKGNYTTCGVNENTALQVLRLA